MLKRKSTVNYIQKSLKQSRTTFVDCIEDFSWHVRKKNYIYIYTLPCFFCLLSGSIVAK